jgi:hypothetical protein
LPTPVSSWRLPEPTFSPATPHEKQIASSEVIHLTDYQELPPSKKRKFGLSNGDSMLESKETKAMKNSQEETEDGKIL